MGLASQVAWLGLAHGRKLWLVAPPHAPRPREPRCGDYNAARRARTRQCVLLPGDGIILPTRWWHATCNLAPWTVGAGGQGWLPGIPYFATLPPAALAALNGDVAALAALPKAELTAAAGWVQLTPLQLAAKAGRPGTVEALLARGAAGADAATAAKRLKHALSFASVSNRTDVKALLRRKLAEVELPPAPLPPKGGDADVVDDELCFPVLDT